MITLTTAHGAPALQVENRPGLSLPRVVVRPLVPGETEPLQTVFDGLSAHSRRMRFLAPVPRLLPAVARTLADIDHHRHGCWVAELDGEPLGIGRYIVDKDDPTLAEVAFEVVDRAQGLGLGRLMVDVVGTTACDVGVGGLLWTMDPHNLRIRQLALPLGGRFEMDEDVLEGRTPLPVLPTVEACRVIRCARIARRAAARRRAA
ncbi:GNAT family N-acetyltransferase [Petropleomorpha daqingensis]|uniref:GNAT superfamily N-acetyltransferase n=1 Tax=Petropleomorpha daqingensis TaxID=2026353 RepID=A0A853CPC1_9ACTN|nr:GNAT family N-acetyltransferase [Petropleomorpha daqingensis]NYJ08352.1 GNAT superfamily N-acetyltransferase [Petropleomorpha daqingensis]